MQKKLFSKFIEEFQFRELFVDLGWNHSNGNAHPVRAGEHIFSFEPIAEKEGFQILTCSPDEEGLIPDYPTRKKLETRITKLYREHLIIFINNTRTEQLWQWMIRKPNQPARISDTRWMKGQSPELLFQKASGLFFSLDEEENITIVDVKERVSKNFDRNNEKVTKTFYGDFKKQHTKFLDFINGIDKQMDKDWYASLMLNRLMFCYFIQKKGFLDGDLNYLQNKLKACQVKKGENEFYNFYRDFLLALFHEGLGAPTNASETEIELGSIPYLNGGLFDEHDLERSYEINIDDEAFERIFSFFDKYEWHLDTSHGATGKEINPDVIGYIFEKYINDRADMGAYYTKEDITDYISKNCILPYLMDETERHYPEALKPDGWIWAMLKESGDTYIYDAVKHGIARDTQTEEVKNWTHSENWWENPVFDDLPNEMKAGLNPNQEDLVELRKIWNTTAPDTVALPTEIWREVIERRKRYVEVRQAIEKGKITKINDLITYNLNIRQFVQDVIQNTDDPKFILHFYKSMAGDGESRHPVSILDPTCGSGAFLFAALNILEPLYESCLLRMRSYTEDEDHLNAEDKRSFQHKYKFFREVLEDVQNEHHPNQEYFVFKSIILRNLYGVDIMREAVEIAKLRLFLKMVATVEVDTTKPNMGLEPLPDIDFNIRAGNTLVGVGTEQDIGKLYDGLFDFDNTREVVDEQCEIVAKAYNHYKQIQLSYGEDFTAFKKAKNELEERLLVLRGTLDEMLKRRTYPGKNLEEWKVSHQPFHWYAEFYDIIHDRGGFDVIIGNPPYVEYSKVKKEYRINGYETESCGNLYAFLAERTRKLRKDSGRESLIVPISIICTQRMSKVQKILSQNHQLWISNYAERPGKLFEGAEVLLTIYISTKLEKETIFTTGFQKWASETRGNLFDQINYTQIDFKAKAHVIPKIQSVIERDIFSKLQVTDVLDKSLIGNSSNAVFYRIGGGRYWKIFTSFQPEFYKNGGKSKSSRENYIYLKTNSARDATISILSSSLFYWYFIQTTNCRDLNPSDIKEFPVNPSSFNNNCLNVLELLSNKLMDDYKKNSEMKSKTSKLTGDLVYQEFYPRISKDIIDKIDTEISKHYDLTEEELDYIINYDIKYRMGSELEEG